MLLFIGFTAPTVLSGFSFYLARVALGVCVWRGVRGGGGGTSFYNWFPATGEDSTLIRRFSFTSLCRLRQKTGWIGRSRSGCHPLPSLRSNPKILASLCMNCYLLQDLMAPFLADGIQGFALVQFQGAMQIISGLIEHEPPADRPTSSDESGRGSSLSNRSTHSESSKQSWENGENAQHSVYSPRNFSNQSDFTVHLLT